MRQGIAMATPMLRGAMRHLTIFTAVILILLLIPTQTVQAEPNAPPGAFGKSNPSNGTVGVSTSSSLNITWSASSGATSYQYCYDTTNNSSCDTGWSSTGSTFAYISPLASGTTYYWQVRAVNGDGTTDADGGSWWSFSTVPGNFSKTSPSTGSGGQPTSGLQLQWGTSSGATSYQYCLSTSGSSCPGSWTSVGGSTSVTLGTLNAGDMYYWQVRAVFNGGYTEANSGSWYVFFTTPGPFGKTSPSNGTVGVASGTPLQWGASSGATSYYFCYDTSDNDSCDSSWN